MVEVRVWEKASRESIESQSELMSTRGGLGLAYVKTEERVVKVNECRSTMLSERV